MPSPELITVPNVPIISTGTYQLASNAPDDGLEQTTFTEADLASAVAALDDPHVKTPRLKLGHTDGKGGVVPGLPTFGVAANLRLSEDGQTIFADYVGVPAWLAKVIPTSWPNRSIEGSYNYKTEAGEHQFVIEAVSLLGIELPGVTVLEDLSDWFGEEVPDGVEIAASRELVVAQVGGGRMAEVAGQAAVEDVRRAYYEQTDASQAWWWIRAILLDPNEVIVDDDDGQLYRLSFELGGEDGVTFGEPAPVKIEYVNAAAIKGDLDVVYATRAESGAKVKAEAPKPTEEEANVPESIREKLGLAEDASEEDVVAAIEALQAEPEETEEETTEEPDPSAESESGDGSPDDNVVQLPSGMVAIDEATLQSLRENSEMGVAARQEQLEADKRAILDEAVRAGKFPPARRKHWEEQWTVDPDGARATISAMAPDLIPVSQRGTAAGGNELAASQGDAYPTNWFPELKAKATNDRVVQEA